MLILKNHIFRLRTIVAAMLLVAALAVISDSAPQQRDAMTQLKLSQLMPRGALLYAQSRDLGAQLKLWRASATHDWYFASKSYAQFEQSRLFLKLQSRLAEFQTALGFELTEDTVSALAGGQTALGIYDLGKLEMVFVSEMPRTRAFATVLYANAKNFDERNTESGSSYYVREFAADGGRTQQRIAFAYLDGKLFLATSEGLIQRALANSTNQKAGDHLSEDITTTVAKANGFAAHDLTLWLDQAKLNANRYFDNYWLHQNPAQLASLKTGLIDLEMATSTFTEHRWFTIDATAQPAAKGKPVAKSTATNTSMPPRPGTTVKAEQLTDLLRFAPPGVQFMEARAAEPNDERLAGDISQIIFGQLPAEQARAKEVSTALASVDTDSSDSSEPGAASGGQYRQLDARFDRDIDDEAAVRLANVVRERDDAAKRFSATLWPIIQAGKPSAFVLLETPQLGANQLFVHFNRAIVVELGDVTALSQPRLEATIAGELQARFVVGNVGQQIRWQTAGGIHSLQQALLEQGGAYAVSGRTLIIASNKEYCAAVLAEGATTTSYQASLKPNLLRYAVARAATGAPVFSKLTKVLDARTSASSTSDKSNAAAEGDSEPGGDSAAGDKQEADTADSGPVSFMSQNLVSLLGVIDGMGEATFEASLAGDVLQEVIIYHLTV